MSEARRLAFQARVAQDLAAAHSAALVALGDRLGLYRALDGAALSAAELAHRTGTHPRYVREWLRNQAASGYVEPALEAETYTLAPEQAAVLAREDDPGFAVPAFQLAAGWGRSLEALADSFRIGAGLPPGRYGADVDEGIARGSRVLWRSRLLEAWLPSDIARRLDAGGAATDLGCGRGDAVGALARAFPSARLLGIDANASAVAEAKRAHADGAGRVRFRLGSSEDLAERAYDLVTCIDALHDLPEPGQAAARILRSLAADGCALVVEPCVDWAGGPDVLARLVSAVSLLYCVPVARSAGGDGRGALEGEASLRTLLHEAGFARVRVVERLPLHVVIEARA